MANSLYTQQSDPSAGKGSTTGNFWLDALGTVANWDLTRRYGLPAGIDGGQAFQNTAAANQNAERTPPAPPGAGTGFTMSQDQKTIAIGVGVALGLLALVAVASK